MRRVDQTGSASVPPLICVKAADHLQQITKASHWQRSPAPQAIPSSSALQQEPIESVNRFTPHRAATASGFCNGVHCHQKAGVWPRQKSCCSLDQVALVIEASVVMATVSIGTIFTVTC